MPLSMRASNFFRQPTSNALDGALAQYYQVGMSENEIQVADQALKGARERIAAGTLFVKGVQIKAIHRGNVMDVFPPGVRELVRRYMRGY